MGNAQGKCVPPPAAAARQDGDGIQVNGESAQVPTSDPNEPAQLPAARTEDLELSDAERRHNREGRPRESSQLAASAPKASNEVPRRSVRGQGHCRDGPDSESIQPDTATGPREEKEKLEDSTLGYSDAKAERPGGSEPSSNVDNAMAEQSCCTHGLRRKTAPSGRSSYSMVLCTETESTDSCRLNEAAGDGPSQSDPKSVSIPNAGSAEKMGTSRSNNPGGNSGSSMARLKTEKQRRKQWGESLLRMMESFTGDAANAGADAFRMPEMLSHPSPPCFRYQVDTERGLRMAGERVPCPPDCAFCRSMATAIASTVVKDEGVSKTTVAEASAVDPAAGLNRHNEYFLRNMTKETPLHRRSGRAMARPLPRLTLNPQLLDACMWKPLVRRRENRCASLERTPTISEPTLILSEALLAWMQSHNSRSNSFVDQMEASVSSGAQASSPVFELERLLRRLYTPLLPAIAAAEWPSQRASVDVPPSRPGSDAVFTEEMTEDPAAQRRLITNLIRMIEELKAAGRWPTSPRAHKNHPTSTAQEPQALRCSCLESARIGFQEFLSLLQQIDNFSQKVHLFLQQAQQFSVLVQLISAESQIFLVDFNAFQLRVERFKQGIDSFAQAVPNPDTSAGSTDQQVCGFDELLRDFSSLFEGLTRLIQTFSDEINSFVQADEVGAAAEETHPQTVHGTHGENQATHELHVNSAAEQVSCTFIKGSGLTSAEQERSLEQVDAAFAENGDLSPCTEELTFTAAPIRASTSPSSPADFDATTEKTSLLEEGGSPEGLSPSPEAPPVEALTPEENIGLEEESEVVSTSPLVPSVVCNGSVRCPPQELNPGEGTSQDLPTSSSDNQQPLPLEESTPTEKPSSSQEHEASAENSHSSKDSQPSSDPFTQLRRAFSSFRRRSRRHQKS